MKIYTHFIFSFLFLVISCKTPLVAIESTSQNIQIQKTQNDTLTELDELLKPYRDTLHLKMNAVIGFANNDFKKTKPSGTLGNLVVEAVFQKAKSLYPNTQGAIYNYGGIRLNEIKKGEITVGKIFEMLPFENELVIVEVNDSIFEKWKKTLSEKGGCPIKMQEKIDFQKPIFIATIDYIANGGDNCDFLKPCKRINTGILIRDIMIEYITKNTPINPQ